MNSVPLEAKAWEASRGSGLPRGYLLVAMEVTRFWPESAWQDMVSVGIAESDGLPDKIGDAQTEYPSIGLFQVRLIHKKMLERLTGSKNPAIWIEWLKSPDNNAKAAYCVWKYGGGLKEWGAWTDGRAKLFRVPAGQALQEVANQ